MKWISRLAIFLFVFSACTSLQRSPSSGYTTWDMPSYDQGLGESPARARMTSNPQDPPNELGRLEGRINTESEYDNYNRYKSAMPSDKAKVEYLKQNRQGQTRWLAANGIHNNYALDTATQAAIDNGDIVLEMPKDAVRKSWGDPDAIEVAGNPDYGNERWVYTTFESTTDGFHKQERKVYFKRGRVIGWESR